MSNVLIKNIITLVIAYLIGSIPFGWIFVKIVRGQDIRKIGSGNIGATNVSRVLGKKGAIPVFLLDCLKGITAVLLARHLFSVSEFVVICTGLVVIAGHSFPLYIGFKGGRGVSTSLGVAIGLAWLPAIISFACFGVVLGITRYVSLGSICAAIALPVSCWLMNAEQPVFWFSVAVCILLIYGHIPNMKRLAVGTEPKVGQKTVNTDRSDST